MLTAALLGVAPGASAELRPELAAAERSRASLPPVSAPSPPAVLATPAPPGLEALLPPGARPAAEREQLLAARDADDAPVEERLDGFGAPGGDGPGFRVRYTVEPRLDARVRAVVERARVPLAHVILIDPSDGNVLSYVSTDPATFPAARLYPAASLMKVVTAAALLRVAPEAAERECRYVGSPYELRPALLEAPEQGGQVDSFERALAISNNQCFGRLAVHELGEEALLDEMRRVGLFDAPGSGHPAGRAEPVVDDLALSRLGSGLAGSFISPLAAVRLAALLAHGKLVQPYWLAELRDPAGALVARPGRAAPQVVWPRERAEALRRALVAVTESGTARGAFRDERGEPLLGGIEVAGKTGSLSGRDPEGRYQWFIGVAPAAEPRVAIAVLVVNGALWWSHASDVAAATLRELFCDDDGACGPERLEPLLAHVRVREARLARESAALEEQRLLEARRAFELDETPRPVRVTRFDFPRALLREKASGRIVLLVDLDPEGGVTGVEVESSDLPAFNEPVMEAVRGWRFTPPRRGGEPVEARARLPIPIDVH